MLVNMFGCVGDDNNIVHPFDDDASVGQHQMAVSIGLTVYPTLLAAALLEDDVVSTAEILFVIGVESLP